jgi:hypothetical protein
MKIHSIYKSLYIKNCMQLAFKIFTKSICSALLAHHYRILVSGCKEFYLRPWGTQILLMNLFLKVSEN